MSVAKDIMKAEEILEQCIDKVCEIDDIKTFSCFIGVMVDSWGKRKNLTEEEILDIYDDVAVIQKMTHKLMRAEK